MKGKQLADDIKRVLTTEGKKSLPFDILARPGFSVVAHLHPEILLIDEVLAVGDMEFQKKCIDKMMGFKKSGVTMIFV